MSCVLSVDLFDAGAAFLDGFWFWVVLDVDYHNYYIDITFCLLFIDSKRFTFYIVKTDV